MKIIILAGGRGVRLWPFSREFWPKQFLNISGKSLIEKTIERSLNLAMPQDIFLSTNSNYYSFLKEIVLKYRIPQENILIEPVAKNTAPAILFSLLKLKERGARKEEVIAVFPSDHFIKKKENFKQSIKKGEKLAKQGFLTILGIKPKRAEQDYGYIKTSFKVKDRKDNFYFYKVKEFIEKPSLEKAKIYLKSDNYFWNIGIFIFQIQTLLEEYRIFCPEIFNAIEKKEYKILPKISIDKAIMEKSKRVVMVPANFNWLDLGSWRAIYEIKAKDEKENVCIGKKILLKETQRSLIVSNKKLVVGIGLKDIILVDTPDAVLACSETNVSQLKNLIKELKERSYPEIFRHQTIYRTWGSCAILENSKNCKVNKIIVKPKQKLDLHWHCFRSEHWIIIEGRARAKIGKREFSLKKGDSVFIPKKAPHSLINNTEKTLELIEIQTGNLFLEEDIKFD